MGYRRVCVVYASCESPTQKSILIKSISMPPSAQKDALPSVWGKEEWSMMIVEVCPHFSLTQEAICTSPARSRPNSVAAQEVKFPSCSEAGHDKGLQWGGTAAWKTGASTECMSSVEDAAIRGTC